MVATTVTPAQPGDVPEIVKLGLATPQLQVDLGQPVYYQKKQLVALTTSPTDIFLAAKVDSVLAGYVIVTYNPYLTEAYLIDIALKPEFRHQGLGSALLNEVMRRLYAKGCGWCWTLVHEDNTYMQSYIQKHGFTRGKKFDFFFKTRFIK